MTPKFIAIVSTAALFLLSAFAQTEVQSERSLDKLFRFADKNKDGKLTAEEAPKRIQMIRQADADKSGSATLEEVKAYLATLGKRSADAPETSAFGELAADAPFSKEAIELAATYAKETTGHALLIQHKGNVVYEGYTHGWSADKPHYLASGTKSFAGAILMAAVTDGLAEFDEPVSDTLTEWKTDERLSKITIRQLLSLTSGIAPGKIGATPSYIDAVNGAEAINAPGKKFAYGPLPFQVFGELMRRKLKASPKHESDSPLDYLEKRVLEPIALNVGFWREGEDGNPRLPSGASLTAREWVKYGTLLLAKGKAGDKTIFDGAALQECLKPAPANPTYGITFWRTVAKDPRLMGAYKAAGKGKQMLLVIPEEDLVIVRFGDSQQFDDKKFLNKLFKKRE